MKLLKWARKVLKWTILFFFSSTILAVVAFRFLPVPFTPLMGIRMMEKNERGSQLDLKHQWVPLKKMSPYMPLAVIAKEDQNFLDHHGFDVEAIQSAYEDNRKKKTLRGGSTITQQTAKNIFLWPSRTYVRKGLEAYFTVLIELFWSKQRIMEVYLNSIEMGDGIFGVEAVAQYAFGKSASELTKSQCALIASTLSNPLVKNVKNPSRSVIRKQKWVERQMAHLPEFPME